MAMKFFCQILRSKTVLSEMTSGRHNFFKNKLISTLFSERLLVFENCGVLAHSVHYAELWLVYRNANTVFEVICGQTTFSERSFVFRRDQRTLYCFQGSL